MAEMTHCHQDVEIRGMVMRTTVLIVEDEPDLAGVLEYNFKKEGFQVHVSYSGAEALKILEKYPSLDLVVLDLMLPDISGMDVCRQIRNSKQNRNTPVLMLTAKSEELDRIAGFEVGADDYVTKPFSVRELMLRVKAILRRSHESAQKPDHLSFGCLNIDVPGYRVSVDSSEISLTSLEFKLLLTFIERKGRVQTREVLLNDVWEINADVTTRTVDTHVKRLREKLGKAGGYIETIRGVGYRFASSLEEEVD